MVITDDSFSLNFNSVLLSQYFYVEADRGRGVIGQDVELLEISGMDGAYISGTKIKVRPIEVDIAFVENSAEDLRKIIEIVNGLLITKEAKELVFEDEEDRVYFAICGGIQETFEWGGVHRATITFICADPYKYGPEKTLGIEGSANFHVEGTKETDPIIKVELNQDTTYLAVSDGQKINLIGNPIQAGQQSFEAETRKFWNEGNTLVGWTTTTTIEGGINAGTLKAGSYYFYTDDYGADANWHGPAMKTSIGATLQDFKIDVLLSQFGASGQVGSIEIDLLDANNQIVAKLLLSKRATGSQAVWARLRAGSDANGYDIINERGDAEWVWANFDGILRLSRVGNVWTAYVAKIDSNGNYNSSRLRNWTDSQGIAIAPVTQVQAQLWQYGTVPVTVQRINDIKVLQLNNAADNQVPYVARAGDIIEFDHQNDIIRRNGEDITKAKAFIGEYFPLNPGLNTLIVEPTEAIESTEVRWKPKWL